MIVSALSRPLIVPSTHMGVPVLMGKAPPKVDERTLKAARYFKALAPPPPSNDWTTKASSAFGQMLNDKLGDCTCAAMAHFIQCVSAANGKEITVSDADVLAAYIGACGYNPSDPSTDRGGVELDVLNYWRQTGIGGYKIDAFVALEPSNLLHVKQAHNLGGGLYIGLSLPTTAQNQDVWHPSLGGTEQGGSNNDATPGSWGGHAVVVEAYDANGLTVITWGMKKRMTWPFWNVYCDEAYMVLSNLWAQPGKLSPSGFDEDTLRADLAEVTG